VIAVVMAVARFVRESELPVERGSRDDLEATLTRLFPTVRRWLHRSLGDHPELDDATQDALFEIARSLSRFAGESSLETWSYRITTRVAYRYLKRRSNRAAEPFELHVLPDLGVDPEARAGHRESIRRFQACLDELTPNRRMAFLLCAVERLPHVQAAEIEGISVETLRARLKRARAELADKMRADPFLASLTEPTR
jgi:RNA polymerase sigma-70 factor (ECF subfamily)